MPENGRFTSSWRGTLYLGRRFGQLPQNERIGSRCWSRVLQRCNVVSACAQRYRLESLRQSDFVVHRCQP